MLCVLCSTHFDLYWNSFSWHSSKRRKTPGMTKLEKKALGNHYRHSSRSYLSTEETSNSAYHTIKTVLVICKTAKCVFNCWKRKYIILSKRKNKANIPLNATLGGHKQNFVYTRNQEKGTETLWENEPDFPMSVWESPAEA